MCGDGEEEEEDDDGGGGGTWEKPLRSDRGSADAASSASPSLRSAGAKVADLRLDLRHVSGPNALNPHVTRNVTRITSVL